MCGIIGITSVNPIKPEKIKKAIFNGFLSQKERGSHSFGVFVEYENSKKIFKSLKLEQLLNKITKPVKKIIFHHRYASVGGIRLQNQHPFLAGGVVLVHNGTWSNHTKFRNRFPNLKSETDSEVIANLIDEDINNLKKITNSSLVWYDRTGVVRFWRDSKPMVLGLAPTRDLLIFASTREAVFSCAAVLRGKRIYGLFNQVYTAKTPEHLLIEASVKDKKILIKHSGYYKPEKPKARVPVYSNIYNYKDCPECESIWGCGADCSTCPFRGGCEMENLRKKYGCSICDIDTVSIL